MNDYETKLHNQYLEPEDAKSFGTDWKGHEIYEGDECWDVRKSGRRREIFKNRIRKIHGGGMIGNEIT